jgi:hypothetical protein
MWVDTLDAVLPEVEKKLMYIPIRAGRWTCGAVLLCLLDELGKEDSQVRATARGLKAHNSI